MTSVFYVVFLPFIFAFVFAFILFYIYSTPLYIPFTISIFSFCSVLLSSILQVMLSSIQTSVKNYSISLSILFDSYIYAATIEESVKVVLFYFVLRFFYPHFKEKRNIGERYQKAIDSKMIIFLSMFFASCFAAFETISYAVNNVSTLAIRMATASLLHILIAQYYLHIKETIQKKMFFAILLPIFIHGSYNFFATLKGRFVVFSFIILIFLTVQGFYNIFGKCGKTQN